MKNFNPLKKTLVLGTGTFIRDLLAEIKRHPRCRYRITGVVTWTEQDNTSDYDYPVLGTADNLHRIIQQYEPEVIIVAPLDANAGVTERQLLEARVLQNIRVEHAQEVYEKVTGKLPLETVIPEDIIYSNDFRPSRTALMSTRLLSLACASIGLFLLAPLMLLIALLIKIDSSGPVLFLQERSGMAGRRFKLLKFRTMRSSDQQESEWEEDNIHRITRVGRWLRKCRLDELPQFFNILSGDMNIVGPRPHPSSNFALFVLAARNTPDSGVQIPYYSMRYSVRPGITGWAQVRYRYANNLREEMEKLRFDLYYLKHYSLWLDLQILFETVAMIFVRSHQGQDQMHDQTQDQTQGQMHDQTQDQTQDQSLVADTIAGLSGVVEQFRPTIQKAEQQAEKQDIKSRDVG